MFFEHQKKWAFAWALWVLLVIAALIVLIPRTAINSSVLALLPQQLMGSAVPQALQDGFMQRLDRQVIWLVSPGKVDDSEVATWWETNLDSISALSHYSGRMTSDQQTSWAQFFYQNRYALLAADSRQRLEAGPDVHANWVMAQLYSAFSGVGAKELQSDPLLLTRSIQMGLQQTANRMGMSDGWLLTRDDDGRVWYLFRGELNHSSYDTTMVAETVIHMRALEAQLQQKWPEAEVLSRGTIFYSDYASQLARNDITSLGLATLIGVFALIFWVFRTLRPLALSVLSVSIGAASGLAVSLFVFSEVHLITLVMSLSIMGISIDYALYYLTERMAHGDQSSPTDSLRKLAPSLLMALVTAAAAYGVLLIAPFPGLQQLAVMAVVGLIASCFTVIFWYPFLVKGMPVRPIPGMLLWARWLGLWRKNKKLRIGLPTALVCVIAGSVGFINVNDDIAQFQSLPANVQQQDQRINELLGQSADQKWFVIYGASTEEALQRLEQYAGVFAEAKAQGWLASYRLLPFPSAQQQIENLHLLTTTSALVIEQLQQAGIAVTDVSIPTKQVTLNEWLDSSASDGWRLMLLALDNGETGILIPVAGVTNTAALDQLAQQYEGLAWIDRKESFDQLFSHYRAMLGGLLIVALGLVLLSYMVRLGFVAGFVSTLPTLLSLGLALSVLAWTGHSLNLFSVLALVLVLGIGINYSLFFGNPNGTPLTSMLAVTLAAATTLLTQGLLMFSSTQAISNFGVVLCSGIFAAFILSPLALPLKRVKK